MPGNEVQKSEAAKPIGRGDELPARHRLAREAKEMVEPRWSTAGQDRVPLRVLDDGLNGLIERGNPVKLDPAA